jgi:hypothetical protein
MEAYLPAAPSRSASYARIVRKKGNPPTCAKTADLAQRLLPATLTLRDWRSRARTNLPNRRGQSGDRLALSGLSKPADSVHLAGQLSVGFGRLLAVGGAADGGEHVSAMSKSRPGGRLPARE